MAEGFVAGIKTVDVPANGMVVVDVQGDGLQVTRG